LQISVEAYGKKKPVLEIGKSLLGGDQIENKL
jgi:hypothetical protein